MPKLLLLPAVLLGGLLLTAPAEADPLPSAAKPDALERVPAEKPEPADELAALPSPPPRKPNETPEPAAAGSGFDGWLDDLRTELAASGDFSDAFLDRTLGSIEIVPRVVELDRRQPEGRLTMAQYLERVISTQRIAQGRRLFREHRDALREITAEYGVPGQYIVALWGIETSYGANTGGFRTLDALATLAYDGRRADFFRSELEAALRILSEKPVEPSDFLGSWAGAMGQNQFMPSSYLRNAVDHDGDGRKDIWTTLPDVFASSSNYLRNAGWVTGESWGRAVAIPEGLSRDLIGLETRKSLTEWTELGVSRADGGPLPEADLIASLVQPDGPDTDAYLIYENFRVVLRWNRSVYFATAVGLLADAIAAL